MRQLIVSAVCGLAVVASTAFAGGPRLVPVQYAQGEAYVPPAIEGELIPGADPVPVATCVVPLYHCVKYRDERKIHPCAVPMVVMVQDPCWREDRCNPCDTPKCVAVQICVPPCSVCPPKVTCRRNGAHVRYDFGKYAVDIRSHRGVVMVDYDR